MIDNQILVTGAIISLMKLQTIPPTPPNHQPNKGIITLGLPILVS